MTTPDELRRLAEAASTGPWEYDEHPAVPGWGVVSPILRRGFTNLDKWQGSYVLIPEATAAFIVAARNALPGILDQLASKDAEIARLRAALELAREGLRPFAADADTFPDAPDTYSLAYTKISDLRRARSTLSTIDAALAPDARLAALSSQTERSP